MEKFTAVCAEKDSAAMRRIKTYGVVNDGGIQLTKINEGITTSLSINHAYPQVCLAASIDYNMFANFRQNPIYMQILEHVSKEIGNEYLRIASRDQDILAKMEAFKLNDAYGNPVLAEYPAIGWISPSTLRYIKVLADLKQFFGSLNGMELCEIGVGYGGQCRIVNAYYKPEAYTLVDIKPALALTQRYLDNYVLSSIVSYKTMNELKRDFYDLAISNYAFTELPRQLQDVYLERVIRNSKRGYITYNEINPAEYNSYNANELAAMIPGAEIFREEPLTHPRNCLIVWGHKS